MSQQQEVWVQIRIRDDDIMVLEQVIPNLLYKNNKNNNYFLLRGNRSDKVYASDGREVSMSDNEVSKFRKVVFHEIYYTQVANYIAKHDDNFRKNIMHLIPKEKNTLLVSMSLCILAQSKTTAIRTDRGLKMGDTSLVFIDDGSMILKSSTNSVFKQHDNVAKLRSAVQDETKSIQYSIIPRVVLYVKNNDDVNDGDGVYTLDINNTNVIYEYPTKRPTEYAKNVWADGNSGKWGNTNAWKTEHKQSGGAKNANLTVAKLRAKAKACGHTGYSKLRKDELVKLLKKKCRRA